MGTVFSIHNAPSEASPRSFADWVANARRAKKLKPEDLAEKRGIPVSTIRAWERGDTVPYPKDLSPVVNVLGAPPEQGIAAHLKTLLVRSGFEDMLSGENARIVLSILSDMGQGSISTALSGALKSWRGDRMLKEAAKALGITASLYSQIEQGNEFPTRRLAAKISETAHLDPVEVSARVFVDRIVRKYGSLQVDFMKSFARASELAQEASSPREMSDSFGNALRTWRGDRSVSEVAHKIGISQSSLHHFEFDGQIPDPETLPQMAAQLNQPLEEIMARLILRVGARQHPEDSIPLETMIRRSAEIASQAVSRVSSPNLFGTTVKQWRGKVLLTDAAKDIGIAPSLFSAYEAGRRFPDRKTAEAIALRFGITEKEAATRLIAGQIAHDYSAPPAQLAKAFQIAASAAPVSFFGSRLSAWRAERGYSKEEFAKSLEITPERLSIWENKPQPPPVAHLQSISRILGIPPETVAGEHLRASLAHSEKSFPLTEKEKSRIDRILRSSGKGELGAMTSRALRHWPGRLPPVRTVLDQAVLSQEPDGTATTQVLAETVMARFLWEHMAREYGGLGVSIGAALAAQSQNRNLKIEKIQASHTLAHAMRRWRGSASTTETAKALKAHTAGYKISAPQYRRIENGKELPPNPMLAGIAAHFNQPSAEVLSRFILDRTVRNYAPLGCDFIEIFALAAQISGGRIGKEEASMALGNFLKAKRGDRSRFEFAEELGITHRTLVQLEEGAKFAWPEAMKKIMARFGAVPPVALAQHIFYEAALDFPKSEKDLPEIFRRAEILSKKVIRRHPHSNALGDALRKWRDNADPMKTAVGLEISERALLEMEMGKTFPSASLAVRMARHFNRPLETILGLSAATQLIQAYGSLKIPFRKILSEAAAEAGRGIIPVTATSFLGRTLHTWRNGSSPKKTANAIGIDESSLIAFENGRRFPAFETYQAIARFYNKPDEEMRPPFLASRIARDYAELEIAPWKIWKGAIRPQNEPVNILEISSGPD